MAQYTGSRYHQRFKTVDQRFWEKVDVGHPLGCWLWTASQTNSGYAQIRVGKGNVYVHRWSYERLIGPIPDGFEVDHLCRVRLCVNPDHLEPVTGVENLRRSPTASTLNARKTHCKHGHAFTEENTYWYDLSRTPRRACIACRARRRPKNQACATGYQRDTTDAQQDRH